MFVGILAVGLGGVGCATTTELQIRRIADKMDQVSRHLEEWGTLSISGPLINQSGEDFRFDLPVSDRELYDTNRTEGAVAVREARAIDVRFSARVENLLGQLNTASDPEAAAAASAVSEGGDPSSTAEPLPEPKLVEAPAVSPGQASAAVGQFTPMLGNYAGSIGMNTQRRINLTANDSRLIGVHEYLSNPNKDVPDGYHAYFFVFTLTVQPGWRTRSGYVGNLDVALSPQWVDPITGEDVLFDPKSGEKLEAETRVTPTGEQYQAWFWVDPKKTKVVVDEPTSSYGRDRGVVVGVFPAFNSQELNLRSSYRQLVTIAAQLSAAGQIAGATMFLEAAHRVEQDAETSTGLATVTSYANGLNFGYEFRPAFRALEQPGKREARPGYRLEPISFPAVAVVLLPDDWRNKGVGLKIMFKPTHSWRPVDPPWFDGWPLLNWFGRLFQTRLHEVDIVQQSIVLDRQYSELECLPNDFPDAKHTLNARWNMLQSLVTHQYPFVTLTAPDLSIASLDPKQGFIDTDNIFVIRGKGLKGAQVAVEGPGVPSDIDEKMDTYLTDDRIVVRIKKTAFEKPASALTFRVEAGGRTVRTEAFVMKEAAKTKTLKTASIEIGHKDGKVSSLKIPNADPDVQAEFFQRIVEILKALRLQPDASQKVDFEFDLKAEKTNP